MKLDPRDIGLKLPTTDATKWLNLEAPKGRDTLRLAADGGREEIPDGGGGYVMRVDLELTREFVVELHRALGCWLEIGTLIK